MFLGNRMPSRIHWDWDLNHLVWTFKAPAQLAPEGANRTWMGLVCGPGLYDHDIYSHTDANMAASMHGIRAHLWNQIWYDA